LSSSTLPLCSGIAGADAETVSSSRRAQQGRDGDDDDDGIGVQGGESSALPHDTRCQTTAPLYQRLWSYHQCVISEYEST